MHVDSHDPQHMSTSPRRQDDKKRHKSRKSRRRNPAQPSGSELEPGSDEDQLRTYEPTDVAPGPVPVPAPVPIITRGHYQVLREKLPISFALASCLLVIVIACTSSFVFSSIPDALSPLCSMPLLSAAPICSKIRQSRLEAQKLPFTKLMDVQRGLLPVMEAAGSSTNLALDFKRVEMKISDLNTLVQLSDLENKDKIASSLYEFEASAGTASRHLSRMESNIEGVVSAVLITDDYVIQTLEHIEHGKQQKSIVSTIISPFVAYPSSRTELIQTFNHMADVMELELSELIESTMAATLTLGKLQINMKGIYYLVSEAQGKTKIDLERTLGDLWTLVGGNRAKLARFNGHHSLLSQIGNYHSTATSKVGQALVELQKLEYDLKRLRNRVAVPMLPNEPTIPLELHIKNLRKGVEVLTEGKFRARKKEDQFIEQMGNRNKYPRMEST